MRSALENAVSRSEFSKFKLDVSQGQRATQNINQTLGGLDQTGANILAGFGAPTFASALGSIYIRRDGTTNTLFYGCLGGTSWVNLSAGFNSIPCYNHSGTVITPHIVVDTVNILAGATNTITLTGSAVFSSATSYGGMVSTDDAAFVDVGIFAQTASTFKITNPDGGAAHNFQYTLIGV